MLSLLIFPLYSPLTGVLLLHSVVQILTSLLEPFVICLLLQLTALLNSLAEPCAPRVNSWLLAHCMIS